MNRKYALPAAIALAAHALVFFVGSGRPPPPNSEHSCVLPVPPTKPKEDEIYKKAVQLVDNELKTIAKNDDGDGGQGKKDDVVGPPGVPDPPPGGPVDIFGPTQDYKPRIVGNNDKIPSDFGKFGGGGNGSGNGRKVIGSDLLDEPPATRSTRAPLYPPALRSSGTTGKVWVEFVVDENGRVHNVKVTKSTHHGFDEVTVAAVSQWRFVPGKQNGLPVRFRMSVPVIFNLGE